jgi:hypothetical protein
MIRSLSLRITLVKPPHGVPLCLQQGKDDLVPPSVSSGEQVSFDFSVNIANDRTAGPPNFRGPAVQGPPTVSFRGPRLTKLFQEWRQMLQVFFLDRMAISPQAAHASLNMDGVPHDSGRQ